MSEQALDLRSSMAVLRRRSRVVLAAAGIGLAAGIAFVALQPPQLVSTTLVLLPAPAPDTPESSVTTQVRIVTSSNLLEKTGRLVKPALTARDLEKRMVVTAPTDQLIQVQAMASRARDAQTLSQGLADAYVRYVREAARTVSTVALTDLNDRSKQLQTQVSALQKEIDTTSKRQVLEQTNSADGRKDAQLLAQLRAEQADTSLQLDKVKGQIAVAAPAGDTGSTSVIQDATPAVSTSAVRSLLLWLPLGTLLGALLASVTLLTLARTDRRVRLRDEIADAVGSIVLAVAHSRSQRSVTGWNALLADYQPSSVDAWAFRQILRALAQAEQRNLGRRSEAHQSGHVEHPRSVTVVSLSGDERGLAIGPQLAAFAASLGITTRLLTAVGNESAASLWAACAADRQDDPRPGLVVGEMRLAEMAELTVVLAVADRKDPRFGASLRTSGIILSVSPGAATEEELARLAVAIDDAGRIVDGIVVADPDRADRTTGRLSLDERSRRVALPVRLTGVRPDGVGDPRQVRT